MATSNSHIDDHTWLLRISLFWPEMFLESSRRPIFLCNYAWHSVPAEAITKKRGPRDRMFQYVFRDRSPRYMMRKQNQQKYPIIVNYHPRKIPVRRVPGTSDPCPESHRRMGFPSWEQLLPPLNIVLTLQPGGITGDHRFPVTVTTIGMMITVAPLRSAGTNWGRWSRCRHVRDSPCRTGCSHCLEESSCQRCFF